MAGAALVFFLALTACKAILDLLLTTGPTEYSWGTLLAGLPWALVAMLWLRWVRPRSRKGATLAGVLVCALGFAGLLLAVEASLSGFRWSEAPRYVAMSLFMGVALLPASLPAAWVLQQLAFKPPS